MNAQITTAATLRALPERMAALEESARNADDRQDRHEDVCADRYKALDDQVTRLNERIDKMLYVQLGALMTGLLALCGIVVQLLRHVP